MKHNIFIVFLSLLLFLSGRGVVFGQSARAYVDQLDKNAVYESKKGNYPLAFQYINKAIEIQPKRMDLYYHRAMIIGRAGDYGKAIIEFSRFVSNKKFPHAVRLRADCYMAIGMYERAVKDYLSFLKDAPRDGKVWSYLAEACFLVGNTKAALEAVQKGLAIRSHWSDRLRILHEQIISGKQIVPHKPLTN
ncbi:tetratricopeptide repeat protein [uncultured Desulfobacter sp.]|uniref:tetratricopeptide repeat protein n=1 Tax=uncultured Desulfobacter sp. TaxID=240139 RepID=UPI002AAC0564|nr:tetratricopeptide repeat protein [uncultured Desulfobacter sp.]